MASVLAFHILFRFISVNHSLQKELPEVLPKIFCKWQLTSNYFTIFYMLFLILLFLFHSFLFVTRSFLLFFSFLFICFNFAFLFWCMYIIFISHSFTPSGTYFTTPFPYLLFLKSSHSYVHHNIFYCYLPNKTFVVFCYFLPILSI
jgi:hypothetical protein